jgi:hypothetical protein
MVHDAIGSPASSRVEEVDVSVGLEPDCTVQATINAA